jgi:uncharacterized protein (TIGR02266 family)
VERRKYKRLPFEARIHLAYDQPEAVATGYSANLARGGIFVEIAIQPKPGTTLSFNLTSEEGESLIQGRGEVVWVRKEDDGPDRPAGIAVRFLELAEECRERLDRVCDTPSPPLAALDDQRNAVDSLGADIGNGAMPDLASTSALLAELGVGEVELSLSPLAGETEIPLRDQLNEEPALWPEPESPAPAPDTPEEPVSQSIMVRAGLADPPEPVAPPSRWRTPLLWLLFAMITLAVAILAFVVPRSWGPPWQWFESAPTASSSATESGSGEAQQADDADPREAGQTAVSRAGDQQRSGAPVSSQARALREITVTPMDDVTEVMITANGTFSRGTVRHFAMTGPPRLVFRIRGITEPYHHNLKLRSPHLQGIRCGLHGEVNPPELSVVLDLQSEQVSVGKVAVEGNIVRVRLRFDLPAGSS